ncbi:CobW family GTP-binding protein [Marinobacter sp. 1Y8]
MTRPIPTHLIVGFLGAGKTTAILDLLKHKPDNETWAVLVNEFGEVGIDGALLRARGAIVREVPGGCMCCVAGLPMQMGLNMLIQQAQPDRLLIEPTGLGHPERVMGILRGEFYTDVLSVEATFCLVDPRRLDDPRVQADVQFQDQAAIADVLIANKTDLCSDSQLANFDRWAKGFQPAKAHIAHTRNGALDPVWLDLPSTPRPLQFPAAHQHSHGADDAGATAATATGAEWWYRENAGDGYFSIGWQMGPEICFKTSPLMGMVLDARFARVKGVVRTGDGWLAINAVGGDAGSEQIDVQPEGRLEIISRRELDAEQLNQRLLAMRA